MFLKFVVFSFSLLACKTSSKSSEVSSGQVDEEYNMTEVVEIESKDFVKCSDLDEKESNPKIKIAQNNECFAFVFPQGVFKQNEMGKKYLFFMKDSYAEPSMNLADKKEQKNENTIAAAHKILMNAPAASSSNKRSLSTRSQRVKRRACVAGAVYTSLPFYYWDIGVVFSCGVFSYGSAACGDIPITGNSIYEAVYKSCKPD